MCLELKTFYLILKWIGPSNKGPRGFFIIICLIHISLFFSFVTLLEILKVTCSLLTVPKTYYYIKSMLLSHEKRFYVSRLASRIHCLAFRVNPEAFRVNPLVFLSKRAAFRAMRKNCFEQSVREPYETFIRFHSELFDNLIVSKWRPYFTFLHIVSDWQNTCVCMLMKINLEKKSFNKIVLIFNKQKKGIKLTKDYL